MVRAKFFVSKIEEGEEGEEGGGTVTLNPVTGGSKENEAFYRWTPDGSIILSTINADALAQFEQGKSFYVDFTPAE